MFLVILRSLKLSSLGPGPGPRLVSRTGLMTRLKRTRAEAIITETPTTHPPPETFLSHCPRLFSKTGLNSCLKRTRAEAKITETPIVAVASFWPILGAGVIRTTPPSPLPSFLINHQKLFIDHVLGLGLVFVQYISIHYSNTKD